ncbi:mannose-specific lectin-like [Tasmannia lanceolata]|uniref:mannose-specific lectin-like n=1 Tax=Tasmannia lanceolata TaxID=3420 RepID=UPI004063DE32
MATNSLDTHLLKPTLASVLFLLLLFNPACYANNVLYSGESLGPGDYGNLKIKTQDSNTLWEGKSGSLFSSHFVLVLQKDRNLVIYGGNVWSTSTEINPNGGEGSGVISAISMADNITVPEVSRVKIV